MNYVKCQAKDHRTDEQCIQLVSKGMKFCSIHSNFGVQNSKRSWFKILAARVFTGIGIIAAFYTLTKAFYTHFPNESKEIVHLVRGETCNWGDYTCIPDFHKGGRLPNFNIAMTINGDVRIQSKSTTSYSSCFHVQFGNHSSNLDLANQDWQVVNLYPISASFPLNIGTRGDWLIFEGDLKEYQDRVKIFNFDYDQYKTTHLAVTHDYNEELKLFEVVDPYGYLVFSIQQIGIGDVIIKGYFLDADKIYVVTEDKISTFSFSDDLSLVEAAIKMNRIVLDHGSGRKKQNKT